MTRKQLDTETFGFPIKGEKGFLVDYFSQRAKFDRRTLHLKRCMKVEDNNSGKYKILFNPKILKLWKKAEDLEDFKTLIRCDEDTKYLQFTAELLKDDWYFLRGLLGDKKITLISDAGGVKVGNDSFNTIISNGIGDGKTRIAIFSKEDDFNGCAFNFHSIVRGNEINIYSYDCGDEIELTINGSYCVYVKDGFVCFKEV